MIVASCHGNNLEQRMELMTTSFSKFIPNVGLKKTLGSFASKPKMTTWSGPHITSIGYIWPCDIVLKIPGSD